MRSNINTVLRTCFLLYLCSSTWNFWMIPLGSAESVRTFYANQISHEIIFEVFQSM